MRQFKVTGKVVDKGKRARVLTILVDSVSKQRIFNNPSNYGFTKVMHVEDVH